MKTLIAFLFFCSAAFAAEKVDIVTNFALEKHYPIDKIAEETGFHIRSLWISFDHYLDQYYNDDVQKVILMNDVATLNELTKIPFEKRILFLWEPQGASDDYCKQFSRVYTYNDDLIDNQRYFKFYYPDLKPMLENIPEFNEKKFCLMISQSYTKERESMIRFFETKPVEDFDYYGCTPIVQTARYRGRIPIGAQNCSHPLDEDKLLVIKDYRFAICFENSHIDGYLTEKIFSYFAGGCVPVYYGTPNVEKYIPKECFIDYRDFQTNEELYQFLKAMPEDTYNQYIANIRTYLKSEQARVFTPQYMCETIKGIYRNQFEIWEFGKAADTLIYRAQEGFVNLDSARQSTIEACGPNDEAIVKTMAEEEDRLGKAAASPNSLNLTEPGITASELKVLFLIPACDDEAIWIAHQKIWRSYMHSDPEHIEAYFIKADPHLAMRYQIDGDIIWCQCEESYIPGIVDKTLLSMECMLPQIDKFDYVIRVSSSSFYHFPRLIAYLESLPRVRCYQGVVGDHPVHGTYASGAGFILSPDLVKLAVQDQANIKRTLVDDDVVIGMFFREHGIFPLSAPRELIDSMEDWNQKKEATPHFHFKIHHPISLLRMTLDLPIYYDLLKKFYGIEASGF